MRRCSCLLVAFLCMMFITASDVSARTWRSSAGTTIEATLVEKGPTHVVLEKTDGSKITVPLAALSPADQNYVKSGAAGSSQPEAAEPSTAAAAAPVLVEGELRTWMAQDGTSIQARLAKQTAAVVVLQKEDGSFLQVPVSRFAPVDRRYLISLQYKSFETQPPPPENYEWPNGKIAGPIECKKDNKWSYFIYLPKNFNLSRKWPVMFIMSPGGGNKDVAKRYVDGAEINDWILVVSVQSKNNFNESGAAISAMLDDVLGKFPVDEKRLYASGFSGGARMAYWLSSNCGKELAGILPCGAGGLRHNVSQKTRIYGLVGSNCFNRWDMACTFKEYKAEQSFLWFFPGKHEWANGGLVAEGMCWLNNRYLESNAKSSKELEAEWYRFMKMILGRIEPLIETDPETAYRLVASIDKAKVQPFFRQDIEEMLVKLNAMQSVKDYKLAEPEMRKLVKKYFETNVMDYQNNNCPDGLVKDAAALADKYKDLKLSATIIQMGGPAPM